MLKYFQNQLKFTEKSRLRRKGLLEHLKNLTEDDTAKYAVLKN
jgi:hypothetical protein